MLDKENMELVNNKLKVIYAAFATYESVHIAYMQSLQKLIDDLEESQRATLQEFKSRFHEKFEFHQLVNKWMERAQLKVQLSIARRCSPKCLDK